MFHLCLASASTVGTRQQTSGCNREASVCIEHEKTDLWLTAFTNEINKLLQHTRATLQTSVEDIEDELMNIENVTKIKYYIEIL